MPIFVIALVAAASVLSAGAAVYSGIQQKKAAEEQAELMRKQAEQEAKYKRIEAEEVKKRQKAGFGASGVRVGRGTPVTVEAETEERYDEWIQNILSTGHTSAGIRESEGRAAFTSGLFSAGGSLLQGAGAAYSAFSSFGGGAVGAMSAKRTQTPYTNTFGR